MIPLLFEGEKVRFCDTAGVEYEGTITDIRSGQMPGVVVVLASQRCPSTMRESRCDKLEGHRSDHTAKAHGGVITWKVAS